jgi:Restriction endonuclease fold toxin 5
MPEGTAYIQNGVKFDGYDEAANVLIDAKYGMDFMLGKGGTWRDWARAPAALRDQAQKQIAASNGATIDWRFSNEAVANATPAYLSERGIVGITYTVVP